MGKESFRVYLRALEPDDYKITHEWRKDEQTWDLLGGQKRFVSSETERKWILSAIEKHEKNEILRFGICMKGNEELIGFMSFTNIDLINRNCRVNSIIGSSHVRGKGLINEARILSYHYMFSEIGMQRIYSHILEDNTYSRKAVEKFGIIEEGILRKAVYKNGTFKDLIVYSMLREEFYQLYRDYL